MVSMVSMVFQWFQHFTDRSPCIGETTPGGYVTATQTNVREMQNEIGKGSRGNGRAKLGRVFANGVRKGRRGHCVVRAHWQTVPRESIAR